GERKQRLRQRRGRGLSARREPRQALRGRRGAQGRGHARQKGRGARPYRGQRRGQEHAAQDHNGLPPPRRGQAPHRGPGGQPPLRLPGPLPWHPDRLPGPRPRQRIVRLPQHVPERRAYRRPLPEQPQDEGKDGPLPGGHGRTHTVHRHRGRQALRRPAPSHSRRQGRLLRREDASSRRAARGDGRRGGGAYPGPDTTPQRGAGHTHDPHSPQLRQGLRRLRPREPSPQRPHRVRQTRRRDLRRGTHRARRRRVPQGPAGQPRRPAV
ncbi:MAG: ABC transporter, ATP-binding protein (cluster 2, ribose/xylose/arabinose/galactose), partial [uncultured Rubrobacteraceae bacterium]